MKAKGKNNDITKFKNSNKNKDYIYVDNKYKYSSNALRENKDKVRDSNKDNSKYHNKDI